MKIKLLSAALFLTSLLFAFTSIVNATDSMQVGGMGTTGNMFMTASFQIRQNGQPLKDADVTLGNQTRQSNEKGIVEFEDVMTGNQSLLVTYKGKQQDKAVDITSASTVVDLKNDWREINLTAGSYDNQQAQAKNLLFSMIVVLLCFGTAMVLIKRRHMLVSTKAKSKRKVRRGIIGSFLVLGIISASTVAYQMVAISSGNSMAFAGTTMAAEVTYTPDPNIPQPGNVKTFGDEKMATVTWDPPANAESKGIIGYVVRWGLNGVLTDSKQTIYDQIQIQPLQKDQMYTVTVQSVKGQKVNSISKEGFNMSNGKIEPMVFNGEYVQVNPTVPDHTLSIPVQTTVKESSARVDAMRARNTGFFDDFNLPSGNFDETKWNTAYTGCATPGFNGSFINSQFHAHNQVQARSDYLDFSASGLPYCDRAAVSSRARGVFDTSLATETKPAIIEVDVDGVPRHRDAWYIDFIPTNARLNGVPVDLEGHDSIFQDDTNEPANVMRLVENNGGIMLVTWDANRKPSIAKIVPGSLNCPAWQGDRADLSWCDVNNKVTGYSPTAENDKPLIPISNVRRHWVVEYKRSTKVPPTQSTLTLSIDGIKVFSYYVPDNVDAIKKYQITTELFSYTTGKEHEFDYPSIMPTTTLFHWDNFGFSGAAQATVVHNYLDGGIDGTMPQYATGTYGNPIQRGNRTAKFNIPDQIGTPIDKGARLMFTMIELGNQTYTYPTGAAVIVNGHTIPVPNPNSNVSGGTLNPIASAYTPHSTGVFVDPAYLVTGMNTVQFNVGSDIINAHIELEYKKGTEPAYTQPQNIFTSVNGHSFGAFITPNNNFNDSYLFVEQNLGLSFSPGLPQPTSPVLPTTQPSATPIPSVIPSASPRPTTGPSATPFPTVTQAPTSVPQPTTRPTSVVPTPTVVTTTGGTLGYKSKGASIDSNDSNFINSSRFVMGAANKTVKSMTVFVGNVDSSPNNKFEMGIYSDKNGKPDQLIAKTSTGTLVANSWNTLPLSATLLARKPYWFAYNTNGTNGAVNNMRFTSGGKDGYTSNPTSFGNWPQQFGAVTIGTAKFSIYVTFQ